MNATILVCCHKKERCATQEPYMPIHVGKALTSVDLGIIGDDTGDNISEKNSSYCELTGIYWAWKNLKDADVVGLCHYRRYFDFHKQCKWGFPLTEFRTDSFDQKNLSIPTYVLDKISKGSIVVSKPQTVSTLYIQYAIHHHMEDLERLRRVVSETCDDQSLKAFDKVFYRSNKLRPFNMFIMNKKNFDEYCKWLFGIIFEFERRTCLSSYDLYQQRIYGFIAERLLNVYIEMKRPNLIEKPVIAFTNEKSYYTSATNRFQYFFRCKALDLSNLILSRITL